MLGVISVPARECANAAIGGKLICCCASWSRTFELTKVWPPREQAARDDEHDDRDCAARAGEYVEHCA
jgi:hypothetical protein